MKSTHRPGLAVAALAAALAACSSDSTDVNPIPCDPACNAWEKCNQGTCEPIPCDPACGSGTTCKQGQCVSVHADLQTMSFQNGWQVTAACVACHSDQAAAFLQTTHWSWSGPTPDLMDSPDPALAIPATYDVAIGKRNLINNFCVAIVSNEKRCEQCHAGYGGDPDPTHVQKSARLYEYDPDRASDTSLSSIPLEQRVDCLVCHTDLSTGYVKAQAAFGAADVKPAAGCTPPNAPPGVTGCASGNTCLIDPDGAPSCYPMNGDYYKAKLADTLSAAVQKLRKPARENCGYCHFYAGGGDGVKLMGSSLKSPSRDVDVHMGGGMTCADCHAKPGHEFSGAGVHVPAHTSRVSCQDCHGAEPHPKSSTFGPTFNTHAARVACQTCHIPKFARGQCSKVDWNWSTAGHNELGVEKSACGSSEVETYSYLKGSFVWDSNLKPAYRWYDGRMVHATIFDYTALGDQGTTPDDSNRITLGEPVGGKCSPGSKIFPFKLMRGKQAVYVDPASTLDQPHDFVINPNVFGPGSLWGTVQSATWSYSTTAMEDLWSKVLTNGARAAGQIGVTDSITPSDGSTAGWQFRTTKLYLDLNHEVAPKEQALGATSCNDCHNTSSPAIPFGELGYPMPLQMVNGCQ